MLYLIIGIVLLVMFVTFLIKLDEKRNDPKVLEWCNENIYNPDEIKFHSSDLSFVFNTKNNNIRMVAGKNGPDYDIDFNGPASHIEMFPFVEETAVEYTDTYAETSRGETITFKRTGKYNRGTGIYREEIRLYNGPMQIISGDSDEDSKVIWPDHYKSAIIRVNKDEKERLTELYKTIVDKTSAEAICDWMKRDEELAKRKDAQIAADEKKREDAIKNAEIQCIQLVQNWGLNPDDHFRSYRHNTNNGGIIYSMLAADRSGNGGAVHDHGNGTWHGSWKNAKIDEIGETLEIQVDDPEYREKNLKERRFVIEGFDKATRIEWLDRIRILAA